MRTQLRVRILSRSYSTLFYSVVGQYSTCLFERLQEPSYTHTGVGERIVTGEVPQYFSRITVNDAHQSRRSSFGYTIYS